MSFFVVERDALKLYFNQVLRASQSASDENQADLLRLAEKIPVYSRHQFDDLEKLIAKLKAFKQNPLYDPQINALAKRVLRLL